MTEPNRRGSYPGVFALINGLSAAGRLTEEQEAFRRGSYAWFEENYANPSDIDPAVYDRERNPGAQAWFRATARPHLEQVRGHLAILAAHGVGCEELRSADPGVVVYEDEHQVVVIPRAGSVAGTEAGSAPENP
ncbi:hypothetical protein OG455_08740 [Kitasatospora sp. NBC_01287]|uniref:hypothetical protein n=1 Tax=Kitasatospora sp. NBC_01287 TaxID=2903573 RepID=UPI00225562ED|nr:hypothetical protein [Kitasatospora sp. NBC_01287]MCX4745606.1 hypothetical protein [Kitasatospora sp. NBC_01287]